MQGGSRYSKLLNLEWREVVLQNRVKSGETCGDGNEYTYILRTQKGEGMGVRGVVLFAII